MTLEEVEASVEEIKSLVESGDLLLASTYETSLLWKLVELASKGKRNTKALALEALKLKELAKNEWYG